MSQNEEFVELNNINKIVYRSDTERPVQRGNQTLRGHNCNTPENKTILSRLDELESLFDVNTVYTPSDNLFEGPHATITGIEELQRALSDLLIRFDTNPNNYLKDDYLLLMKILSRALLFLYEKGIAVDIVKEWSTETSDTRVASEKLVKTELDNLLDAIDDEEDAREAADADLQELIDTIEMPEKISDLTDDTATNPIELAKSLQNLLASITELNYSQGVTSSIQTQLNSKGTYSKPDSGIPKSDLASAVQTSLGLADTALQSHLDISGKENIASKVTSISASSTDTEYPSAKATYTAINDRVVAQIIRY